MAGKAISKTDVQKAAAELASMRGSLASWMKFRALNDRVLAGGVQTKKPLHYAQRLIADSRDMELEQDLANKIYALLEVVMEGQPLPDPDVSKNQNAAMQLAALAVTGGVPPGPTAVGGIFSGGHPWMWPLLIVGALVVTITTAIKTTADVAKDREEKACITAGACTDYGFWLKAGGVAMLAWLAWTQMGVGAQVKSMLSKRRS